jgi:hypothetical protein
MTGTPTAGSGDPQVRVLAREVDRNKRQLAELDAMVRQIAGDVASLARAVSTRLTDPPATSPAPPQAGDEEGDPGEPGPPGVWSWLLAAGRVDPEMAADDVTDLVEWVDRVYLAYPSVALSPCWLWHPDVVEELRWLRALHDDAFDPENGSWRAVADWHDRYRSGVVRRVAGVLGTCELLLHAQGRERDPARARLAPLGGQAARVAAAWADPAGGRMPVPTPDQLAEAQDYQREQYRGGR